jgi:hypothetical protein
MRRILIALAFLALMSIPPIARTVATPNTVQNTASNTVSWVPLINTFDPSSIPKSDAVTIMPAGVTSTYNVYPSTTSVNTYYTLSDTWFDFPTVAVLAPQATGHYDFYDYVYITNPSYKWACACFVPDVVATPYNIISGGSFDPLFPNNDYLVNAFASNITWSGQNLAVWKVHIIADVVSTSGVFNVIMLFNQLHTDISNNGKVDPADLVILANHYPTTYNPDQPRNYAWNIVMDFAVDYSDLVALQVESGRTIPP